MPLYDVQFFNKGGIGTDLTTGSKRRALNRRDELNRRGQRARVQDDQGETVWSSYFERRLRDADGLD